MKLKELLNVIVFDTVCLYHREDDGEDTLFKDIYEGKKENVPEKYMEVEVKILGAKRKNLLDIQLDEEEIYKIENSS